MYMPCVKCSCYELKLAKMVDVPVFVVAPEIVVSATVYINLDLRQLPRELALV